MKQLLIIIACFSLFVSCNKDTDGGVRGTLHNYSGFDGCGWVIELDKPDKIGSTTLEPLNLKDCMIELKEGQKVVFSYVDAGAPSVCMVGPTVKIKHIRKAH